MKVGLAHCHDRLGQAMQRSAYCGLALSTQLVTTTITGWCECTMAPHSSRTACRVTALQSCMAVLVFLHADGGSDRQLPTGTEHAYVAQEVHGETQTLTSL